MAKKKKQGWENPDASFDNPFGILKSKAKTTKEGQAKDDTSEHESKALSKPTTDVTTTLAKGAGPSRPEETNALRVKFTRLERARRGGKQVTIVGFIHSDKASRELWLKDVQKRFGIGGSLEGEHVTLQGDQRDRLNEVFNLTKKTRK